MSAITASSVGALNVVAPGHRSTTTRLARALPGGVYALKPIGRSPAYFKKPDENEQRKSTRNPVLNLFGNGDAKARIAQLEYELETERAYSSSLGLKLKDAEAKAIGLDERLAMYVGRLKEADKDIFKLERQLEEQQKGLDNGMAIAKKQIRRFEEKLVQAETERCRLEEKLEELQKKAE